MAVDNGLTRYVTAGVKTNLYRNVDIMLEEHDISPGLKSTLHIHHVLPVSVANGSALIAKIYEGRMGDFQEKVNDTDNLIILSTDGRAAEALGMNQHKSNHPDLRDATDTFLSRAYFEYLSEIDLLDPDDSGYNSKLIAINQKYEVLVDRFIFRLKDGNVAAIDPDDLAGGAKPEYAIYGSDRYVS